eukprot:scaffold144908_cov56-Attheya_sp.AAC.5
MFQGTYVVVHILYDRVTAVFENLQWSFEKASLVPAWRSCILCTPLLTNDFRAIGEATWLQCDKKARSNGMCQPYFLVKLTIAYDAKGCSVTRKKMTVET